MRIFAPATSANLNVGFDVLGVALQPLEGEPLGDWVSAELARQDSFSVSGPYADSLGEPVDNVVVQAWQRYRQLCGQQPPLALHLHKGMPVGSGLGSSAASVVAAVLAIDGQCQQLSPQQKLALMAELEGRLSGAVHWDNLLPCLYGGLRLGEQALPVPDNWLWLVAYPPVSLETRKMRALLPDAISRSAASAQASRLGQFVAALYRQDGAGAAALMTDPLVEPYRAPLIPGFDAQKTALLRAGALAAGLSGSGPTVFAVFDDINKAQQAADQLRDWAAGGFVKLCRTDMQGARQAEA